MFHLRSLGTAAGYFKVRSNAPRAFAAGVLFAATACASDDGDSGRPPVNYGSGGAFGSSGTSGVGGSGGSVGSFGNGGSNGASGSGGTGGSSGGSGGASGSTGTGGATGSGGTGGATGSGGTGGTGGATGSGGTGGATGTGGGTGSGGTGGTVPDCGVTGFAFCDDFEDGNASGWSISGGSATWSIVDEAGNFVYQGRDSQESWAGPTFTDHTVEARVKVIGFGGGADAYRAGIMARRSGTSDFYALQVRADGMLSIRKSTSVVGGCAQVASGATLTDWFTLRLEVSGAAASVSLRGYVNGQLKLTCTHASGLASGQVGFVTYGGGTSARFDDIRVSTP